MPAARTAAPVDVTSTAAELSVVAAQLIRRLRTESAFPAHQLMVLGRLDREGPRTTSRLAISERVRPQSMAATVADLVTAELVTRRPDPEDGRQVLLELTDEGRTVLERERRARTAWLAAAIGAELDEADRAVLDQALVLVRRLLDR
ncbi:MarR family transcriptional regulator [Blastococcus sp. CT_GayMR16]|uniref:MarR family winged helix-turn-helix transcriptional regulator n=1 Tax=Blastococcus sp. CT_GayMR16 TaxID=2559607 RepID=UPI001ADDB270|nr:MarR family transcriptional regulator [Blastococcus sp. CT_GayMR16]